MSGKSYTMKEMLSIVEYIIANKFYDKIRGRKMWMDFASSQLTMRTWQSLKETFLKRILPDIHNPYYGLTNDQISSFRAGYDVMDKNKNKLEIRTISDDSNSNGHNPTDNEQAGIITVNSDEGESTTGENKCSKIPQQSRSSADTVILENCYETAEEIQKDLESNGDKERDEKPVPISKSLRDCITYSEPLTPMLQEVLDDFTSEPEDSDRENQMEIVDSVPNNDNPEETQQVPEPTTEMTITKTVATDVAKNAKGLSAEVVEEVLAQELDGGKPEIESPNKKKQNIVESEDITIIDLDPEISSMQAENGTENRDDANQEIQPADPVAQESVNTEVVLVANDSHTDSAVKSSGLNNSNSTVDSSLPNNPEALKNNQSKNLKDKTNEEPQNAMEASNNFDQMQNVKKSSRKRSYSEDTAQNIENKKKKIISTPKPLLKKDKILPSESHLDKNEIIRENVELKTANEQSKVNNNSNETEIIKPQVEKNACDLSKPSTSFDNTVVDKSNAVKKNNKNESPEIKNPCLKNVSLFDEHFNKTRYNMSESSDTEQNKKETEANKPEVQAHVPTVSDDVVMLKSHTESDTEEVIPPPKKKTRTGVLSSKTERDKAITNMFGFSGGVSSKRKRQLNRRRRTISHNNVSHHNTVGVSNSSEWTSETDSETYVSPPRGRKNRPTKKYLKPQAAKILSLEEEGGLFVMYGKKIYPLVKDGKIVKNYLTYLPESDSEEGESYWKLKYAEEKKKAEDLKKLLEQAKEPPRTKSPILQANPLWNSRCSHHQAVESTSDTGKEICVQEAIKKEEPKVNPPEKIKIKFTKNNEEVHLEGHWPQIHPVLEQVVQIFHKEVEATISETKSKMIVEPPDHPKEPSSGISTPLIITPVDPEVHEKVNKIEKEIFKDIERLHREEDSEPAQQENNVTKRQKVDRSRKSSSTSVTHSPIKQRKTSDEPENTSASTTAAKTPSAETENKDVDVAAKRPTRTLRKVLNETVNTNETIQTRRSKQKLDLSNAGKADEEEVRYMLPPKNKRQSLKSPATRKTNQKPQKSLSKSPEITTNASLDNFSLHSTDSTQGYQDSDVSPVRSGLRKKKKLDMSSFVIKTRNSIRRSTRRKSHPYQYCDAYNDSSNSSADAVVKIVSQENSSLNTDPYRSDSYQLLLPRTKTSLRQLEPIDETSQFGNKTYFIKHLGSTNNQISVHQTNNFTHNSGQMTSDVGSSSNVSLPMSPELSVVENMSISKDMINSIEDYSTINEMQSNEIKEPTLCNKYMMSDIDVSIPLMQQDCEFESCNTITKEVSPEPKGLVTESLLSKIGTFNLNDQVTATDTLDKKLHDLLLDSAKKMTKTENAQNKESFMDIDVTNIEVQKKAKAKKRCSTPRKRTTSRKSIPPKVDPVVEEEHVESCSHSGRKSCPPQLQTFLHNENVNEEINNANQSTANKKPKAKKKKDIIRVKIQRPKNKKTQEKNLTKLAQNTSRISVFTDSGINDTESEVFLNMNDSVDLIHNHSETCLHANECVGDSVEFVDNSKSVITLDDSMQSGDNPWTIRRERNDENKTPDLFCNNAQDVSFYNKTNADNVENSSDTVYHSPLGTEVSHNSLITEDLSDDPPQSAAQPTKWYLLSEDETTNKSLGPGSAMLSGSFGSNLKQLFPISCAIPDLSTITEMSRENDDSKKPMLDGFTTDDFNSQSIFDSIL